MWGRTLVLRAVLSTVLLAPGARTQPTGLDWHDPDQVEAVQRAHRDMQAAKAAEAASEASGKAAARRVKGAFSFGGLKTARPKFDAAMRAAGSDATQLQALAYWLAPESDLRLGEFALEAYRSALRLDPSREGWWRNYAVTLAQMQRFPAAARAAHRANLASKLDPGPKRFSVHLYLAHILRDQKLDDAVADVLADIRNPGQLAAFHRRVYDAVRAAAQAGGEPGWSLAETTDGLPGARVVSVKPGGPAARLGLQAGDVVKKLGHERVYDAQHLEALVELKAGAEVRLMLRRGGRVAFVTGSFAAGADRDARALSQEGIARFEAGDHAGATEALEAAVRADPTEVDAWYNLGLVRQRMGDPTGAVRGLGGALALGLQGPDAQAVQRALATLAAQLGKPLPGVVPEQVAVLTESAHQSLQRELPIQALLDYLRALRVAPGAPLSLFGAFSVASTLGLEKLALRFGEAYLRVYPEAPNRTKTLARMHRLRTGLDRQVPAGGQAGF